MLLWLHPRVSGQMPKASVLREELIFINCKHYTRSFPHIQLTNVVLKVHRSSRPSLWRCMSTTLYWDVRKGTYVGVVFGECIVLCIQLIKKSLACTLCSIVVIYKLTEAVHMITCHILYYFIMSQLLLYLMLRHYPKLFKSGILTCIGRMKDAYA